MTKEFHQTEWDALVEDECRRLVCAAVMEDLDRGQDWTTLSLVSREATGKAAIVARQAGVIAGLPAVRVIVDEMDRRLQCEATLIDGKPVADGLRVQPGTTLGVLTGPARSLLTAERLILNFLGKLSGIATQTGRFVDAVEGANARIYDTRKTTPGWRRLEKYAVRQGGGHNHRTGLFDAILIKDNHLAQRAGGRGQGAGSLPEMAAPDHPGVQTELRFTPGNAVHEARRFVDQNFPADDARREMIVEVEVDSLVQLEDVLPAQPDIVLLDNMSLDDLRRAVELRNRIAPDVELEASGGVSLATIRQIAQTGVDRISAGALTHSAVSLDIALDWM